jgi:hypothetical protein
MGGIMASSPELMQAAQRFNLGGVAMASPLLDTTDEARAARGFARLQDPSRRDVVADLIDTSNATPFQEDIQRARIIGDIGNITTDLARGKYGAAAAPLPQLLGSIGDYFTKTREEGKAAAAARDETRVVQRWFQSPEARDLFVQNPELLEEAQNDPMGFYDRVVLGADAEAAALETADAEDAAAEDAAADEFERLRRVRPSLAPEDDEGSIEPQPLTQEQADKVTSLIEEGPTRKKDLRSRYEETLALFKDVYGVDDNDQARDKAMSLATIGLAIAAGQSPNALTNIAQGLLVGTQGIAKRREAARERETKLRIAALETAAEQMKVEAENVPEFYDDKATKIETPFGEFDVFATTLQGAASGRQDRFKNPKAVVAAYQREMDERNRVEGSLNRAQELLRTKGGEITGLRGAGSRFISSLGSAINVDTGIDQNKLTPAQEYDTIMIQLAAELAPVILGESGRTISDGDRQRVAEALGFVVDKASIGGEPGITIKGFKQTVTAQPEKLLKALDLVSERLMEAYRPADDFMRQYFPDYLGQEEAEEGVVIQTSDGNYVVRNKRAS